MLQTSAVSECLASRVYLPQDMGPSPSKSRTHPPIHSLRVRLIHPPRGPQWKYNFYPIYPAEKEDRAKNAAEWRGILFGECLFTRFFETIRSSRCQLFRLAFQWLLPHHSIQGNNHGGIKNSTVPLWQKRQKR